MAGGQKLTLLMPPAAVEAADAEGSQYRVLKGATVRTEVDLDSDPVSVLEEGEEITVLEVRAHDETGQVRLRFDGGWTSLVSRGGEQLLERIGTPTKELYLQSTEQFILGGGLSKYPAMQHVLLEPGDIIFIPCNW